MPQLPRTKPARLFKHKVASMAPCSEGFSVDAAGDGQSQKEDPQHVTNTCSLKEGQTLADLVLTNVANPLHHITKTNLKLVQVGVGTLDHRDCPHPVHSVAFQSQLEGAANQITMNSSGSGAAL